MPTTPQFSRFKIKKTALKEVFAKDLIGKILADLNTQNEAFQYYSYIAEQRK